jgi:TolB-like protein/Tfp pilus assembly protein PilF
LRDLGEFEVKHGLRLGIVNLYKDNLGNPSLPEKLQRRKRRRQTAAAIVKPVRSRWSILTGVLVWSLIALAIAMSIYVGYDRLKRSRPGAIPAPEKSIAVLPFENRSEEKANAYFAEGIQDEILTRLSKIADLKVISRTSTQQYQTSAGNIREIAKQLGVAHIVEGSVQKNGDAVRVNVQLINAAADSHLWSETFDRKLTDIFSVESEIAKSIADHLRAELTGREEKVVSSKPTDDAEAYDAYLRGLAYTLKAGNTSTNARAAQKYFKQAVERDAKFALAWALLSYNDARGYITSNLDPTVVLQEEAQRAAETALSLQPDLGEALFAKGFYHYACLKDYDTAARYFEQARQLLPNSSRIPESLAYVARRRGDWVRSESYFNEAELLDPRNVNLLTSHAHSYIALRRFSDATHKLDQILDITPDDPDTLVTEVAIAQAEGNLPRAAAILGRIQDVPSAWHVQAYQIVLERVRSPALSRLKKGIETSGEKSNGDSRFWLGWAEKACGDNAAAEQTWQQARAELESSLSEQPENAGLIAHLALTNIGLGNKAAALALSERALGVVPIEKDALVGGMPLEIVARATAQGAPARAITVLEKLLSIPYAGPLPENIPLTRALLRLDPMFDSLRQNPKFEQLLASAGRNQ